ncbi:Hydrogen cyanide synthase subunit HcnB [Microbacterium lemovicicum]|uniref:Hydrogen cyanide synthase subunit HcnB n=1 Tax=Microbacterium lemovicicum TaxID=1072463 RepID=A0A3Q9IZQ6_9MICO|nr:FAD-dependent oxidoreductase [Microbacterium lemovicicum]AZS37846.1 Hydrogen cyanide synthase subunit HcnB [Microbacterium lemovicicum]
MRITSPGIGSPEESGAMSFDGRDVPVRATDTIASAMLAAGERGNREDGAGGLRGVWCGMGVCHECTVRVDGGGGSLACVTPARPGQVIETQPVKRRAPEPPEAPRPESEIAPDVLVIGAGPAGLAAATELAVHGLDVLVTDDRTKLGGQYYKQPDPAFALDETRLDGQYVAGRRLIDAAKDAGVRMLLGTTVWAAFDADRFLARSAAERWVIRPRRVIIATGAYERGVPIPGWTLPGVMTTGAGQSLLRSQQVAPGSRVLIAGNGPLNIQLAAELARAGVRVVALVEAARMLSPLRAAAGLRMTRNAPALTADGIRYLASLAARRVPIITGAVVERMDGDVRDGVSSATVAAVDADGRAHGRRRRFDVDAVCLGYGFLPSNDLARGLGARHDFDAVRGTLVTATDETGRTSIPTVWSIGDAAGVRGAKFAQAEGLLAAEAVAADLAGRPTRTDAEHVRAARRHLAFQRGVNALFAAPVLTDQLAEPDTVVCRCEGTCHGDIVTAMTDRTSAPGSVKRITRAGMGKCQGRYCGPVLTDMQARLTGVPAAERSGFAPQAPVKPVPIGDVAAS